MKVHFAKVLCIFFITEFYRVTAQDNVNRFRKIFSKGSAGSGLKFQQGDNVVSFIIPNKHFVSRPYLYYFALSEDEVISFKPSKQKLFRKVYPKIVKPKEKMAKIKLLNRKHTSHYIGPVGGLVARMMVGVQLYFNLFFCNDKHYVYYLTYGAYSDKWYEDHVFRVSKKCPVRAPLTRDSFRQVFKAKTFTLRDGYDRPKVLTVKDWKDPRWSHPKRLRIRLPTSADIKEYTPDPLDYVTGEAPPGPTRRLPYPSNVDHDVNASV